jgi:hypothetical protein
LNHLKKFYFIYTALIVFIVYLFTLAPSVIQIDSGELAAVQKTLGIAHPTGYPLFTLLGYFFTLLPLPFRDIYKLNLLAAIWCSAGIGVFVYTVKYTLDNLNSFRNNASKSLKSTKEKRRDKKINKTVSDQIIIPENKKYFSAIFSGFILAFSKTYWFQSTSVEVYSLHIFLISLIILFLLKAYLHIENGKGGLSKYWIFFAIFLALGFTNHMTTLLILPGAAYLYFNKNGFNKRAIKRIALMLVIFLPVLILIYVYLPVRASQEPLINWGNPIDLERIIRHISGKQYQVWLFSSMESAKKQFVYFFTSLPKEFSLSLFIILLGFIVSFIKAKRLGIFIFICFVSTILYSINYDINDIDSYFLLAYISLSFFSAFGIVQLFSVMKFKKYSYSAAAILVSLFILLQAYFNFGKINQSNTYTFEDYTKALLNSTTKNAVIFGYQWDYFISPSYYFQFVENYRRDVAVVDKELLRRSWYYNQLENNHPGLLDGVNNERDLFLKELAPFEQGKEHNPNMIETFYRRFMTNLVATNINKRDFYITPELFEQEMQRGEFSLPEGYQLVPDLLSFKVVKGNSYVAVENPDFKIRFPKEGNTYTNLIEQKFVGPMLARRALYEIQFDRMERARLFVKKIRQELPDYPLPKVLTDAIEK